MQNIDYTQQHQAQHKFFVSNTNRLLNRLYELKLLPQNKENTRYVKRTDIIMSRLLPLARALTISRLRVVT